MQMAMSWNGELTGDEQRGAMMPTIAPPGAGTATPEQVQWVKSLCRSDPNAKSWWCTWCDANTGGTKDPSRMDSETLARFMEEYQTSLSGTEPPPPTPSPPKTAPRPVRPPPEQPELAEVVRIGQRVSPSWKSAWVAFAKMHGQGIYDPAKHTKEFLQSYLEFLGASAIGGDQAAVMPPHARGGITTSGMTTPVVAWDNLNQNQHQNPYINPMQYQNQAQQNFGGMKRPRDDFSDTAALDAAAEHVKNLQKMDPVKKQQWSDFCDAQCSGIKDPKRHSLDSLYSFLEQYDK
mmetsp:Transcript_29520/g.80761  ORF Transcript_29520/g.80761 Transcript_29520/m.80761 type:complete len:291 (+) Transcript_29520:46-918(+)